MKRKIELLIGLTVWLNSQFVIAQQGFGTNTPAASAVIDMVASNKGFLMPRVALIDNEDTVTVPAPANALTVFNTASSGIAPNDVKPGYYYWSDNEDMWVRLMTEFAEADGSIGNEVTDATANGGLVRVGSGNDGSPYTLGLPTGTVGQVMMYNGSGWGPASTVNMYNTDGFLAGNRVVSTNDNTLNFSGNGNTIGITTLGTEASLTSIGSGRGFIAAVGGNSIVEMYADDNNLGQVALRGAGSTGLGIRTEGTVPIILSTSNTERMRIMENGKLGIAIATPSETVDVNGTARVRDLPLNGAANAIFTTPAGGTSATKNQTFTATRTLVADANGVMGYVASVPTSTSGDATRFLGGTAYVRFDTTSGGTLATSRLIGGATGASYTVGSLSMTSSVGGINSLTGNGYTISNPAAGIFDIMFNTPMTEIYGISVNIVDAYGNTPGSPSTNPNATNPGSVLRTNDNSQVSFISNTIIRIKTGKSDGLLSNRSFTFLVTGK